MTENRTHSRRSKDLSSEDEIRQLSIIMARLDERSENMEKQLEVNSKIVFKLKEKQVQACAAIEHMEKRYSDHLDESHEADEKLEKFVLDYEKMKAKGGLVLMIIGIAGAAVWQGAFEWFKSAKG